MLSERRSENLSKSSQNLRQKYDSYSVLGSHRNNLDMQH